MWQKYHKARDPLSIDAAVVVFDMGNAEKLTPLIFLLVLLHLFRPGKKHGPFLLCPFYIVSFKKKSK